MHFFLFLHDWNHAWKIHPIFFNTSNNLPEISLFRRRLFDVFFYNLGVFFLLLVHTLSTRSLSAYTVISSSACNKNINNKINNVIGNNHGVYPKTLLPSLQWRNNNKNRIYQTSRQQGIDGWNIRNSYGTGSYRTNQCTRSQIFSSNW